MQQSGSSIRWYGKAKWALAGAVLALFWLNHWLWGENIALDHPHLAVRGAWFGQAGPSFRPILRHDPALLADPESGIDARNLPFAHTQAHAKLQFATRSARIDLEFVPLKQGMRLGLGQGFAVLANGVLQGYQRSMKFTIHAPNGSAAAVQYQVVLPVAHAVALRRLRLASGQQLLPLPADARPVLVALGDSISHGIGHHAAPLAAWPYRLAGQMDWQLVNLAVAGATTGPAMARHLAGRKVDVVTLLIGFNDWYRLPESLDSRVNAYLRLLQSIRQAQPQAWIFAITPLESSVQHNIGGAPYTLAEWRIGQQQVLAAAMRHDPRLVWVDGTRLATVAMLIDGIHLSEPGAAHFAANLAHWLSTQ